MTSFTERTGSGAGSGLEQPASRAPASAAARPRAPHEKARMRAGRTGGADESDCGPGARKSDGAEEGVIENFRNSAY
ncbi:hypothetical protein Acidovoranil_21580 [Acidovorax sp. FG27]